MWKTMLNFKNNVKWKKIFYPSSLRSLLKHPSLHLLNHSMHRLEPWFQLCSCSTRSCSHRWACTSWRWCVCHFWRTFNLICPSCSPRWISHEAGYPRVTPHYYILYESASIVCSWWMRTLYVLLSQKYFWLVCRIISHQVRHYLRLQFPFSFP